MTESKTNRDERKSLKASPPVWKRIVLLQRSMEDPETMKRPSREKVVEMAVGALERERLKQSSPIGNKSDFDSLTPSHESVIIPVRPTEKVHIEGLLAILRSGQADAIQTITESIKVLSMELEESRDAGVPEPKGKTTTRPSRSDADARGGVAGKVRKSVTSISGKRD